MNNGTFHLSQCFQVPDVAQLAEVFGERYDNLANLCNFDPKFRPPLLSLGLDRQVKQLLRQLSLDQLLLNDKFGKFVLILQLFGVLLLSQLSPGIVLFIEVPLLFKLVQVVIPRQVHVAFYDRDFIVLQAL